MHGRLLLALLLGLTFSLTLNAQDRQHLYPIVKDERIGFMDSSGQERIPAQFERDGCSFAMLPQFSEGLARVEIGRRLGYIDQTGKFAFVLSPQSVDPKQTLFVDAQPFREGIAAALTSGSEIGVGQKRIWIDRKGQVVFAKDNDQLPTEFHEGLLRLVDHHKWGYVDHDFHWVIRPQFQNAEDFSEGRALVWIDTGSASEWAYIDKTGSIVFRRKGQSFEASSFSGGLARINVVVPMNSSNGGGGYSKFEFVDHIGHEVIGPSLDGVSFFFSEGYAFACLVCTGNGMAIIDKHGTQLTPQEFDAFLSSEFHEGLAPIRKGRVYGYIDPSGRWVLPPQFDEAHNFSDGLALVAWYQKREWAYVDKHGNAIWKGVDRCQPPLPQ